MSSTQSGFFKTLGGQGPRDPDKFLTEVSSLFQSDEIIHEVRMRIKILKEISAKPDLKDVSNGLSSKLTQIFTQGGSEAEILKNLVDLTEIERADGGTMDLRHFLTRDRRKLDIDEYRRALIRKIENTNNQIQNLIVFSSGGKKQLKTLSEQIGKLTKKIKSGKTPIHGILEEEQKIRASGDFKTYEKLKIEFLKDWLSMFPEMSNEKLANLSREEIQLLVQEHQRHQMTQLLKSNIKISDLDMTAYLGLHDTLECTFKNESFWSSANIKAKKGFREWILLVLKSFAVIRGQRYVMFQSQTQKDMFLMFGVAVPSLDFDEDKEIEMIPYVKPFTSKSNYMLEIRNREIMDTEQYQHELRHYTLPFIFGIDSMPEYEVEKETISFFTSQY